MTTPNPNQKEAKFQSKGKNRRGKFLKQAKNNRRFSRDTFFFTSPEA